jgi:hypothetical protein
MMVDRKLLRIAVARCALAGVATAQQKAGDPEQSPRKAILEMFSGSEDAFKKHLTLEVQEKLKEQLRNSALGNSNPMQAVTLAKAAGGDNLESFDAGPILFSYNNPQQHERMEIRIDSEDLQRDQDEMQLSLHAFHSALEEDLPARLRLLLVWRLQQNIWRLYGVTVSASVTVGDPRIFDKSTWIPPAIGPMMSKGQGASDSPAATNVAMNEPSKMTAARAVRLIAMAENIYAKKHPETGFTCFLSELVGIGKGLDDDRAPYTFMDPEFANGIYNGYRFSLNGCAGSPVKSFHVTAEPVSGTGRAYCSDSTRDLHASDDGVGAHCVTSGKIVQR